MSGPMIETRAAQRACTAEERGTGTEDSHDAATQPPAKRPRRPLSSSEGRPDQVADQRSVHPIGFWAKEGHWPREFFGTDMERALARKRFLFPLERKPSDSASSATPSDQQQREEKSAQYRDPRYQALLAAKGVLMAKSKLDITAESKTLCDSLLEKKQPVPEGSLFRDESFESACQKLRNRNEERVIQDISRLIVPSAENLATLGATHLENLMESVNEGWNNSIPLTGTRPQPDYSAGFGERPLPMTSSPSCRRLLATSSLTTCPFSWPRTTCTSHSLPARSSAVPPRWMLRTARTLIPWRWPQGASSNSSVL
ncbi:uncharacterized protein TrAtP1_004955 [Trichoderma atroviride]|uniref:uncharacterized protein n=1 Tax=Hypocrea atroviridis TaxID=63577 RepID=UPI003319A8ED|nr:hypothetical protein TrAtP1_004955 [Trichoderma atroviride]